MALALRGWGPEAFARAKPEFAAAARWGLFCEKAAPFLASQRQIRDLVVDKDTPGLAEIVTRKAQAAELIPLMEAALYPEDDPSE